MVYVKGISTSVSTGVMPRPDGYPTSGVMPRPGWVPSLGPAIDINQFQIHADKIHARQNEEPVFTKMDTNV